MNIFHNVYDKDLITDELYKNVESSEICVSSNADEIEKRIDNLDYIVNNNIKSLEERIEKGELLDDYYNESIDNLLLLISFIQKNIVILQEYQFINEAKITILENTPWYKRITVGQRQKLLELTEKEAKEKYRDEKLKRFAEIEDIINNIQERRKNHDGNV